jgi:hypothetical protein
MSAEDTMDEWGDEVPEWKEGSVIIRDAAEPVVQEEDAESSYHTFVSFLAIAKLKLLDTDFHGR